MRWNQFSDDCGVLFAVTFRREDFALHPDSCRGDTFLLARHGNHPSQQFDDAIDWQVFVVYDDHGHPQRSCHRYCSQFAFSNTDHASNVENDQIHFSAMVAKVALHETGHRCQRGVLQTSQNKASTGKSVFELSRTPSFEGNQPSCDERAGSEVLQFSANSQGV
uniref:Uncharacterized protein n=1 Tax=Panagrolaimus sp. JU765 TaxID=591449 RepID=A0AC34QVY2_9BILA